MASCNENFASYMAGSRNTCMYKKKVDNLSMEKSEILGLCMEKLI